MVIEIRKVRTHLGDIGGVGRAQPHGGISSLAVRSWKCTFPDGCCTIRAETWWEYPGLDAWSLIFGCRVTPLNFGPVLPAPPSRASGKDLFEEISLEEILEGANKIERF